LECLSTTMADSSVSTSFTSFSKNQDLPENVELHLDDIKLEKQGIDNRGFQVSSRNLSYLL